MKITLTDATAVEQSGNIKTGKITVTNRSIATCPSTCPFLNTEDWTAQGCYGQGRMWWQVNRGVDTITDPFVMSALARDRVLGDITVPIPGDDSIDWEYVQAVQDWAERDGATVFGYTHSDVWRQITGWGWRQLFPNYVLNISCHTLDEVAQARALGWNAVISNDDVEPGTVVSGDFPQARVIDCPAVTRDGVTCESCGLCANAGPTHTQDRVWPLRTAVIRFPIHGSAHKQARAAVARHVEKSTESFPEVMDDEAYERWQKEEEYESWLRRAEAEWEEDTV